MHRGESTPARPEAEARLSPGNDAHSDVDGRSERRLSLAQTLQRARSDAPEDPRNRLSLEQLAGLWQAWDFCDEDDDGKFGLADLRQLLGKLGLEDVPMQDLPLVLRSISGSGAAAKPEVGFAAFVNAQASAPDDGAAWAALAFDRLDADGDGFVAGADVQRLLQTAGENPSRDMVDCLLTAADPQHAGRISKEQFLRLFAPGAWAIAAAAAASAAAAGRRLQKSAATQRATATIFAAGALLGGRVTHAAAGNHEAQPPPRKARKSVDKRRSSRDSRAASGANVVVSADAADAS